MESAAEGTLAFRKPQDNTAVFQQSGTPLRSDNPYGGKNKRAS